MAEIRFESFEDILELLNPFKHFEKEVQRVQMRRDPLLGTGSVYNPALRGKAGVFFGAIDWPLIEGLARESAETCIFCPKNIARTARYPQDLVPDGRLTAGEAVLFPNLFALGKYHAVVTVCQAHFLKLSEFEPTLIANAFRAIQQFAKLVYRHDAAASFVTVNANYLFPAGASVMHPHLQVLVTAQPYTYHGLLLDACRDYFQRNSSRYHLDLIYEERRIGARYIAQTGPWHWLCAYSPTGSNEILAAHEDACDFALLSELELQALADGLYRVLCLYEALGHLSFNWSLFSVRTPSDPGQSCLLKIVNRQNPYPNYRNDDYFMQKLLQAELILRLPEELAQEAKAHFSGAR
jgi:UDPglucose--hexose-1-phosphate uridylyltransferase